MARNELRKLLKQSVSRNSLPVVSEQVLLPPFLSTHQVILATLRASQCALNFSQGEPN
jgi:hypothetical protein